MGQTDAPANLAAQPSATSLKRTTTAILAIDAAWTSRNPSGVALLQRRADRWHCAALAPSYAQFEALAGGIALDWQLRPSGSLPDLARLLAASRRILGGDEVQLITVDMPLSLEPITGRREADSAVSRAFGRRGCAVHSPSAARPGQLADQLRADAAAHGYPLATTRTTPGTIPALLEVYPHPALLTLLNAGFRIPYKVANAGKYWPGTSPRERVRQLLDQFRRILDALREEIANLTVAMPAVDEVRSLTSLKALEDTLDALVCGWVGIEYLEGRCQPYGDETAAIWIPVGAEG